MTQQHLLLWRHGRTAYNSAARLQGQVDIPLDEVGHWQARTAASSPRSSAASRPGACSGSPCFSGGSAGAASGPVGTLVSTRSAMRPDATRRSSPCRRIAA